MCVIRKAQEHRRNVELDFYKKVGPLVRPSIHELSWKKKGRKDASISWPNLLPWTLEKKPITRSERKYIVS